MKKSFVCSLIGLCTLMLAGCGETTSENKNTVAPSTCPGPEKVTVTERVEVPVDKTYVLTVPASDAFDIVFADGFDATKVVAGSTVSFTVTVRDAVNKKLGFVKVDGIVKTADEEGKFSFVMPNKDIALEVEVIDTGASEIMVNPDVDETALPSGFTAFEKVLKASNDLESKYVSSAVIEDGMSNTKYEFFSGKDASITKSYSMNQKADNARPDRSAATIAQNGIADGYFYSIKSEAAPSTGFSSGTMTDTATTFKIVPDETEKDSKLSYFAKETLAKKASTSFFAGTHSSLNESNIGVSNFVRNNVFTHNNYFDDDDTNPVFSTKVSDDKKSYTFTAKWFRYYSYSKSLKAYESVTTIDGLGLMTKEEFSIKVFAEGSFSEASKGYTINEGAVPTSEDVMTASVTRGVKNDLTGLKDIHDYVMDDYDIHLQYSKPEKKGTYYDALEGKKVENGGVLTYKVSTKENKVITPSISTLPEEMFKATSFTDIKAIKKGTGEIEFDNGLGVMKKVPVEVIDAIPTLITPKLEKSKIYVGDKTTLTAKIAPAAADQSFTVKANESSTGEVKLTKKDDGSYEIEGVKEGAVTLDVTSDFEPTIVAHLDMNILVKPVKETVLANLAAKTVRFAGAMHWGTGTSTAYCAVYINFNADGTGTQRGTTGSSYSGWSSLQAVKTFSWTMNDDFTFTITAQTDKKYVINSFKAVANDAFDLQYQGAYNYTNLEGVGLIDRVEDLSTLKTSDIPAIKK